MKQQLDLFEMEAPKMTATLYRFPLARRADMVRSITAELLCRDERAGRKHWNAHVRKVRRQLRSEGLASADIDSEIKGYAGAVRIAVLSSLPKSASK